MDWRETLRLESDRRLQALVDADSRFTVDEEQPMYRGGTHYVTFGSFRGRPSVYKYFVSVPRWRNESACLDHLRSTGLVPSVYWEEPEKLIVMERLPGQDVGERLAEVKRRAAGIEALSLSVGQALGHLATVPPPIRNGSYNPLTDFVDWGWNAGIESITRGVREAGSRIVAEIEYYSSPVFRESLARIEERWPEIAEEGPMLFHEDISNLRVDGDRFVGLYDLELCRGGTPSMQLGAALSLCGNGRLSWRRLVAGFEEASASPFGEERYASALAMHDLSRWIRIIPGLLGYLEIRGEDEDVRRDAARVAAEFSAARESIW